MSQLSEVHLAILPGSEQGLALAEVTFEANFTKQELAQKTAYSLSIGLFAVYEEGDLPEPAIGLFGEGHPHASASGVPMRSRWGHELAAWQGAGASGRHGLPSNGAVALPRGSYPQQPQGMGGPLMGQPFAQGPFGVNRAYPGAGGFGEVQGYGYPSHPASVGPMPRPGQPAYYPASGVAMPAGPAGYGAQRSDVRYDPRYDPRYEQRYDPRGDARELTDTGRPQERFLFWVCRELITATTAPIAIQRRVLFDPYTFLQDTPLLRGYVWLLPERTEGRSWSNLAQIPRSS